MSFDEKPIPFLPDPVRYLAAYCDGFPVRRNGLERIPFTVLKPVDSIGPCYAPAVFVAYHDPADPYLLTIYPK
jgi:hypothetical protein